jgi:glucose uptake protein
MILPATYQSGLLLMIFALLCAGFWTSTFKAAKSFRYELYYLDFSAGVLLFAIVAAYTLGSLRSSELTFSDNLLIANYHQMAYAVAAGMVFNLANVVMLAAISVGGIALCVPLTFGMALLILSIWNFVADMRINAVLLFGGVLLILAAGAVIVVAYFRYRQALAEAAKKAFMLDPRSKEGRRKAKGPSPAVPVALAVVAGVILGFAPQVLDLARVGDSGIAPYGLTLLFSAGVFLSTLIYAPFVLAFPIGGVSVSLADYFRAGTKGHVLGILGGVLFCSAALSSNIVAGTIVGRLLGPVLVTGLAQAVPLVAIVLGLIFWKEFSRGSSAAPLVWGGFLLYAVAVALIAFAPVYGLSK